MVVVVVAMVLLGLVVLVVLVMVHSVGVGVGGIGGCVCPVSGCVNGVVVVVEVIERYDSRGSKNHLFPPRRHSPLLTPDNPSCTSDGDNGHEDDFDHGGGSTDPFCLFVLLLACLFPPIQFIRECRGSRSWVFYTMNSDFFVVIGVSNIRYQENRFQRVYREVGTGTTRRMLHVSVAYVAGIIFALMQTDGCGKKHRHYFWPVMWNRDYSCERPIWFLGYFLSLQGTDLARIYV